MNIAVVKSKDISSIPKFDITTLRSFTESVECFFLRSGIEATAKMIKENLFCHIKSGKQETENTNTNIINSEFNSLGNQDYFKYFLPSDSIRFKKEINFYTSQIPNMEIESIRNFLLGYFERPLPNSAGLIIFFIIASLIVLLLSIFFITVAKLNFSQWNLIIRIFCIILIFNCFILETVKVLAIFFFKKYFYHSKAFIII